jgi:hypothetical protein
LRIQKVQDLIARLSLIGDRRVQEVNHQNNWAERGLAVGDVIGVLIRRLFCSRSSVRDPNFIKTGDGLPLAVGIDCEIFALETENRLAACVGDYHGHKNKLGSRTQRGLLGVLRLAVALLSVGRLPWRSEHES